MANKGLYKRHLKGYRDLITPYEEIRAGFVELALAKSNKAIPYIAEARALKVLASSAKTPKELLGMDKIQPALLAASGVSDKAASHLKPDSILEIKKGLVDNFLEPAGGNFVEELVFRFLLTKGDSLGGSMRNLGGALGERKLTRAICATLRLVRVDYHWLDSASGGWIKCGREGADAESIRGISWNVKGIDRTIIYNKKIPFVGNNIDVVLLSCSHSSYNKDVLADPSQFIALGELKGGIDPAGADEHWKTASKALSRIRDAFKKERLSPDLFFIAAAIEKSMAEEIWKELGQASLSNAANLTNPDQVSSLCNWLCSL